MTQLHHPPVAPEPALERAPFQVEIHDLPPREAAVVTLSMASEEIPSAIGEAFEAVATAMATAGIELAGPPFTRYLSFGPVIEAEAGFPVMRPAPDIGRVHATRMPSGRMATLVHVGPYEALESSYALLSARLDELGLAITGPMWEIYWSDPGAEPDPAAWRTELLVPVEGSSERPADEQD